MTFSYKVNKALVSFFVLLMIFSNCFKQAQATDLPANIVKYIKQKFNNAVIRFDGLIELADGNVYIPVIPVIYPENKNSAIVSMTLPINSKAPDLILFTNNLSLLRVIKNEKGQKTFISGNRVPLKVKLGLLPQDLIVPEGFVIPKDLISLIGNLNIPVEEDINVITEQPNEPLKQMKKAPKNGDLQSSPELGNTNLQQNEDTLGTLFNLSNRFAYISTINGNSIYKVDLQLAKVAAIIKVGSIPYSAVLNNDGSRLYVACLAGNTVATINTTTNEVENVIKVGIKPSSITITPDGKYLFVSNGGSGNVSVIDTEQFEVINEVNVQGIPDVLVASNDNNSFYIFNRASGIVSKWNALNPEIRQFLCVVKNPYAIAVDSTEERVFVVSRTDNKLMIFNIQKRDFDKVVEIGDKPVDVKLSPDNKIVYTLDAGKDQISVIDTSTLEVIKKIDLMSGGFPSSLTLVPNTSMALITNAETDKILLVDLDKGKIIVDIPVGITSKFLVLGQPNIIKPVNKPSDNKVTVTKDKETPDINVAPNTSKDSDLSNTTAKPESNTTPEAITPSNKVIAPDAG